MANNTSQNSSAEAEVNQVLTYLSSKADALERWSDKLRISLLKLEDVFNDDSRCRICGQRKNYCTHDVSKQHQALNPESHEFQPMLRIKLGTDFELKDERPFLVSQGRYGEGVEDFLVFEKGEIGIREEDGSAEYAKVYGFGAASREELKAMVKTGRLLAFLQAVGEAVRDREADYKAVSELAEKMAQAISS